MSINNIGINISVLRKEKGITQEELAKCVGVSAQAVSKWENGGLPDTELLPKIADFFEVSIDTLFGRTITNYGDLQSALRYKIAEMDEADRFKYAFEICFDIERALCGEAEPKDGTVKDYENTMSENSQTYSSVLTDYGFTRMGIANKLQYFLLVPERKNDELAFFEGQDYTSLFAALSDKTFFDTCVMLNKRELGKAFTQNLLIKNLKMDPEKAKEIIEKLSKYHLISTTKVEVDDVEQEIYNFNPSPSFIALLIFAREMLESNRAYNYYMENRNKPYLK